MKTRTIATLVLILAFLSAITYYDYKRLVDREETEIQRMRLVPVATDKINSLTVENKHGKYKLEKRADAWWIVEPFQEIANQTPVHNLLLQTLDEGRKFSPFDASPNERRVFGAHRDAVAAKAGISLTIGLEDREPIHLFVGLPTTIRGEIYLADEDSPGTVWITGNSLRSAFGKELLTLRDHSVLGFDFRHLTRLSIQSAEPGAPLVALQRQEDHSWNMTKTNFSPDAATTPTLAAYPVETTTINELFQEIEAMKAIDTLTSATYYAPPSPPGSPPLTLRFEYDKASPEGKTTSTAHTAMDFRALPPPDNEALLKAPLSIAAAKTIAHYAMAQGREMIFEADEELPLKLRNPVKALRSRLIINIPEDQTTWLQIEWTDPTSQTIIVALERPTPQQPWTFANDPEKTVNQTKVQQYLIFCQHQIVRTFNPNPSPLNAASAGLLKPHCRVTVANSDRSRRDGFEIGRLYDQEESLHYARRVSGSGADISESEIFGIEFPEIYLSVLQRNPSHFNYRPLLPFNHEDAAHIEIQLKKEENPTTTTVVLARTPGGASAWNGAINQEPPRALPDNQIQFLMDSFDNLEYLFVAPGVDPETIEKEGLNAPSLIIRVSNQEGKILAEITLDIFTEKQNILARDHSGRHLFLNKITFSSFQAALGQLVGKLD